jgi:nucleotide-binding universal stress UspA family protein
MFEKILVAHDGSDGAQKAFDAAVELASRLRGSLHMISVEEDLPRYAETMSEVDDEKEAEDTYFGQLAAQAKRRAALHSVSLECSIVPDMRSRRSSISPHRESLTSWWSVSRAIPRPTSICGAEHHIT